MRLAANLVVACLPALVPLLLERSVDQTWKDNYRRFESLGFRIERETTRALGQLVPAPPCTSPTRTSYLPPGVESLIGKGFEFSRKARGLDI